jgi:predicted enzyme related to lactoylglutathione lyase
MPPTTSLGHFVWHELATTDPDAAVRFYSPLIGWTAQPWAHDPSYTLWNTAKTPRGGLMRLPDSARRMGAPPHWMPYIAVRDVDQTVREAQALGARPLAPPQDIATGRFATLADPQGAGFAVYTLAAARARPTDSPSRGEFAWHELATRDWRAAWEFYSRLLGWEHASSVEMGPGNTYWMFQPAGSRVMIGGMYTQPPEMTGPPQWLCYVTVRDVDAAAKAVTRTGGRVASGPLDVPGARIAMCVDPQGAAFAITAARAAPKRRAPKRAAAKRKVARKRKVAKVQGKRARRPRPRRPRARR